MAEVSGGPAGAYFDKDGGTGDGTALSDDIALIVPYAAGAIPTFQTFEITGVIDTGSGATFSNIFIPGTYTNDPNIELVVTTDPNYVPRIVSPPVAVSKPSTAAILGLGGIAFVLRRRKLS